ncbi:DUF1801 domain-containing protein [Ascidiimonas aurantiaca]|uniref:DUF1801 domain-containing protein n=1 Tax=Ascidiimonas aurantiaca TaxID=1685432 RepID=UPI0030EE6581
MAANKTQPTNASVTHFINSVTEGKKREDSMKLLEMMRTITGEEPVLWGPSLIGFGKVHYKYKSGREGDWFLTGFSPRKQNLSVYVMPGFKRYEELMQKLGKYKTGKSCLYIKTLGDIDVKVLHDLITLSTEHTKTLYN